jgi:hypothetical protein
VSFRCPITGRAIPHGTKPVAIITVTRHRVYYDTPDGKAPGSLRDAGPAPEARVIGRGWEVVEELLVSAEAAQAWWERPLAPEAAP